MKTFFTAIIAAAWFSTLAVASPSTVTVSPPVVVARQPNPALIQTYNMIRANGKKVLEYTPKTAAGVPVPSDSCQVWVMNPTMNLAPYKVCFRNGMLYWITRADPEHITKYSGAWKL